MTLRKVGILGGTFDPVHIGHLIVAEEVRARLHLDRVVFVPARISPHKVDEEPCPPEHRLRMVEYAVCDNAAFHVSRVDIDRRGPSFTVQTLAVLRDELGAGTEMYFIMGMDALDGLTRWRDPERILCLSRIVAVSRPGYDVDLEALEAQLPRLRERLITVSSVHIGISATDLRQRIREGLPIRYQVPAQVEAYIRRHGLYGAKQVRGSVASP